MTDWSCPEVPRILIQQDAVRDDAHIEKWHIERLADLRDSGAIEQDADAVIFLHRPDMYDDEEEKSERVQVKVNVAKNRHAGTGEIDMQMELASGNFSEAEWRYG